MAIVQAMTTSTGMTLPAEFQPVNAPTGVKRWLLQIPRTQALLPEPEDHINKDHQISSTRSRADYILVNANLMQVGTKSQSGRTLDSLCSSAYCRGDAERHDACWPAIEFSELPEGCPVSMKRNLESRSTGNMANHVIALDVFKDCKPLVFWPVQIICA